MKIRKTDVLVVGGGGAGLRAALAAREKGAEVLVVSKTPLGKSTCTYLSAGALTLAAGGVSPEGHLQSTLKTGRGVNVPDRVEILVREAPERVRELERRGLKGEWGRGNFRCLAKPPALGAPLVASLADWARGQGVSELPWIMVTGLVVESGRVVGALGFDFRRGESLGFLAKAVILASGGGAALYRRHDNPVRATGDGYVLAYDAGCRLRDMEFVQFIPTGLAEPGRPGHLVAASLADAAPIVNSAGEDILEKYGIRDKPVAVRMRDLFSLAIFREEAEGREVFIDLRPVAEEDWNRDSWARGQRQMLMGFYGGAGRPLRISPMCHFFIGGAAADDRGETEVPGLFVCGEAAGGLHGANRMGGNALSEVLVFGERTGKAAGERAREQEAAPGSEEAVTARLEGQRRKLALSRQGPAPRSLRRRIGEILWEKGGISRDGEGMASALDALAKMAGEDLPGAGSATPKEVLEKMEAENALRVGEMILRSALFRRESRGVHYRSDLPRTDDVNWKGNIFLKKKGEGMDLEFRPLPGKIS